MKGRRAHVVVLLCGDKYGPQRIVCPECRGHRQMEKTFRRRRAFAVEMRTFTGNKANYLAMTTGDGNFHPRHHNSFRNVEGEMEISNTELARDHTQKSWTTHRAS